jgi:hypothetical protein
MVELARVFNKDAVAELPGGHAQFSITVSSDYAGEHCEITAARSLRCVPCDGGGCDACARRGAFRLADEAELRVFSVQLPNPLQQSVRIRIPAPFGPSSEVALLFLHVELAETASASVKVLQANLLPASPATDESRRLPHWPVFVGLALVVAALLWRLL